MHAYFVCSLYHYNCNQEFNSASLINNNKPLTTYISECIKGVFKKRCFQEYCKYPSTQLVIHFRTNIQHQRYRIISFKIKYPSFQLETECEDIYISNCFSYRLCTINIRQIQIKIQFWSAVFNLSTTSYDINFTYIMTVFIKNTRVNF